MALSGLRQFWQISFPIDPNDPHRVPRWTDLSTKFRRMTQYARGQQYELGQSQGSRPEVHWWDPDEDLNPINTGSPYYPFVQPYREVIGQGLTTALSSGNLLNSTAWRPNDITAFDPSFEAYTNGATAPNWLTAVGAVVPTITTTNPQEGTKSTTYTVAATGSRQGLAWTVPCVPGQQYTTSAYIRQSTGSTQRILVGDQTLAYDLFDRTEASGWGTADFGGAWSTNGGSASDFSVSSGQGKHSIGTLSVRRFTYLGTTFVDTDQLMTITIPAVVTGTGSNSIFAGLVARYADADNHYRAEISFLPQGALTLEINKRVAAATTQLDIATMPLNYGANSQFGMRFEVDGSTLRARIWPADRPEPSNWHVEATDTAIAGPGAIGATTAAAAGVTNTLPVVISFDELMCSGSTASSTTTTSGSYVRLTKTFTADQPFHTVTLATSGTATAGTVNIDAIQHEMGGSANAFTTTGPNIFPLIRGYAERFTRQYRDLGYTGLCVTPVVDSFAALNNTRIDTEYFDAVMELNPDYYWPLASGGDGISLPEVMGATDLTTVVSKYGAGTAPVFGAPTEIPGDPNGSGVQFTVGSLHATYSTGTILGAGPVNRTPTVTFPRFPQQPTGGYPRSWGCTVAAWFRIDASATNGAGVWFFAPGSGPTLNTTPMLLQYSSSGRIFASTHRNGNSCEAGITGSPKDDGRWHLAVGRLTQDDIVSTNTSIDIFVDGVLVDTETVTTASMGGLYNQLATSVTVGGQSIGETFAAVFDGVIAHVAAWSTILTDAQILNLYNVGATSFAGELTGERITRHLAAGPYGGASRIDDGSSTMQAPSWSGSIDLLSDSQASTNVEDGRFWGAADGAVVFEGRDRRWLRITPMGIFGEDDDSGEIPYLGEPIFDLDPNYVFANVQVQRINGAIQRGGTVAQVMETARKYFARANPTDSGDYGSDAEAQYKADWTFNTHRAPLLRVAQITIDPGANPSLWSAVLNLENGQRHTVKRRATAGNAGAGVVMSADFFIEQIVFNEINAETGKCTVTLFLSPIGLASEDPNISFQPWILQDATYGVLDSTTILGW